MTATVDIPVDVQEKLARQIANHGRMAQDFAARFQAYSNANEFWGYVPPKSDDPEEWEGITKWCALEVSYIFHCEREALLKHGGKPTYCPLHGEAREGFRVAPCFKCAWDIELYDNALAKARALGRQWEENVRAGRESASGGNQ